MEAFSVGEHFGVTGDGKKKKINVTPDFINSLAANYDVALHEAPATIGHPEHDAPAYGWISDVRVSGDKLELQFSDTEPQFEQMVKDGRFKKRSLKLYLNPLEAPGGKVPGIRHCAFLGAEPPAIKGLKNPNVNFKEDEGETITIDVEFSEGEQPVTDPKKPEKSISEQIGEYFQNLFKKDKPETASFSEADRKTLIEEVSAAASLAFSEELKKRDTKIAELTTQVNTQVGGSQRAAIVSFCEPLEAAGKLPKSFRRMGGVEALEGLASLPSDKKVATIEFAEVDGKRVEEKKEVSQLEFWEGFLAALPPYIQFGEQFKDLNPSGDGSDVLDPKSMDEMRAAAGIKAEPAKS